MSSNKPYLLRAYYEWITNNSCTPYLLVRADAPRVILPKQYSKNEQLVLNISVTAVDKLIINDENIEFYARFSGIVNYIYLPMYAILAIYAKEDSSAGIEFPAAAEKVVASPIVDASADPKVAKCHLKLVDKTKD